MHVCAQYWMNPIGVHFSAITTRNLVLVSPDGFVHPDGAQLPVNAAGIMIHHAIHMARPDVQVAAHCHSLHGKAWCVSRSSLLGVLSLDRVLTLLCTPAGASSASPSTS